MYRSKSLKTFNLSRVLNDIKIDFQLFVLF